MFVSSLNYGAKKQMLAYIKERSLDKNCPVWFWSNEELSQYCLNSKNLWCGRLKNSQLVATIFYGTTATTKEIYFLETHPHFLRNGYMASLLANFLKDLDAKEVWADVHVDNIAALNLYNRLGFKEVGRRASYYRDGGDSLLMTYADAAL